MSELLDIIMIRLNLVSILLETYLMKRCFEQIHRTDIQSTVRLKHGIILGYLIEFKLKLSLLRHRDIRCKSKQRIRVLFVQRRS